MKVLFGATALALTTVAPVSAAPIYLDVEFAGVSATFFGLDDEIMGVQSSTGFSFDGVLGTYSGSAALSTDRDSFEFSAGSLISADFFTAAYTPAYGSNGVLYLEALSVGMTSAVAWEDEYVNLPGQAWQITSSQGPVTFTQRPVVSLPVLQVSVTSSQNQLSAVPLPAGSWLLLSGLAGIMGLKRWKS